MTARTAFALIALLFLAGRTPAGSVDKAKLRELAQLPKVDVDFEFGIESVDGFHYGKNHDPDYWAEIVQLQKQMKYDASDAERYLLLGRLYNKVKREKEAKEALGKAVALCRQQVREHPKDMNWQILLGETLTYNQEEKEGEALLRRGVKEAPNEWRGWLALADCVSTQCVRAFSGGKPWSFSSLEKLIPALMEVKITEEQIAEMRRLRKEALGYYNRAVELAPHDEIKPYYRRIGSNMLLGYIEGILRIVKGERINPMAQCLPELLPDLRCAVRRAPDVPEALGTAVFWEIMSCVLNHKLEKKEDCSSWADQLARRNRSLLDVLPVESRDSIHWCLDRLEQLTKHPDKPTAALASEILAVLLIQIKIFGDGAHVSWPVHSLWKDAKILEHLRRAVQLDPSREGAWDWLASTLDKAGETEEAINVARRRVELKDNARNRFLLAKAYEHNKQFDEAAGELHAALQIDHQDLNCRLGLIALELKRGDAQSLQEAGERLQDVWPRIKEAKNENQ